MQLFAGLFVPRMFASAQAAGLAAVYELRGQEAAKLSGLAVRRQIPHSDG